MSEGLERHKLPIVVHKKNDLRLYVFGELDKQLIIFQKKHECQMFAWVQLIQYLRKNDVSSL